MWVWDSEIWNLELLAKRNHELHDISQGEWVKMGAKDKTLRNCNVLREAKELER